MKRILSVLLPIVIVLLAGLAAYALYLNRPDVSVQPPPLVPPTVRVQPVEFRTRELTVTSQGTVRPRVESQVIPEISGRLIWVAPSFAAGGFFDAGETLVRIDPYDYQQAVITARSQLAQARLRVAQQQAEARIARRESEELGVGDPTALALREPQLEEARAAVAAAEAALDRAQRDLERAEITAPYTGRVRSETVDVGQFVSRGTPLATIYSVDVAEVRLPIPDDQLAFLDLPLSYRDAPRRGGPRVRLRASFAGATHEWQGRIVRTEGEIDPRSRMLHLIAEVRDPYAAGNAAGRPPLAVGMYVDAEIDGRRVEDVAVLPRAALRADNRVLIVDHANRLRFRDVQVLRTDADEILIANGLAEGERVCISPLDVVTDGMLVRVIEAEGRATRARVEERS